MRGLKCIGGTCDGQIVALRDGQKHYMVVERLKPGSVTRFNPNEPPSIEVSIRHVLYVIDRVCFSSGNQIEFLRPEDWTSEQALRHVLSAT